MKQVKIEIIKMGEEEKSTINPWTYKREVIRIAELQQKMRAEDEYINWGKDKHETILNYARNAASL